MATRIPKYLVAKYRSKPEKIVLFDLKKKKKTFSWYSSEEMFFVAMSHGDKEHLLRSILRRRRHLLSP